mgnify:CR=1 FL=1
MRPGPRNLITDVPSLRVGNARDDALRSGATVLLGEAPFACGFNVMGGAPGTRETELLAPDKLVQGVDALVLSGGSAFGLAACDGVMAGLHAARTGNSRCAGTSGAFWRRAAGWWRWSSDHAARTGNC